MLPEELVDAACILERLVLPVATQVWGLGFLLGVRCGALVQPAARIVGASLLVEPGEDASQLLGALELLADDDRGVGVADDVFTKGEVVLQDVTDQPTEEDDVRSGAEREPEVGHRRGPAEAR